MIKPRMVNVYKGDIKYWDGYDQKQKSEQPTMFQH